MIPLALTLLLAAACSMTPPPGTDGDLGNRWPSFAEPVSILPNVGDCITTRWPSGGEPDYNFVIDCSATHEAEAVFVGKLADADAPPAAGSDSLADAWHECDRQASSYLGRDWTGAMLRLRLRTASAAAWRSGSRWFRCDLVYINVFDSTENDTSRTGTVRGSVPAGRLLNCVQANDQDGYISSLTQVPCTSPHNAEFAGAVRADDLKFPTSEAGWRPLTRRCVETVGGFLGVSGSAAYAYSNVPFVAATSESQWESGQRVVRCFLWMPRNITKSARGSHGRGVPTY